jgi:hypothetical protein
VTDERIKYRPDQCVVCGIGVWNLEGHLRYVKQSAPDDLYCAGCTGAPIEETKPEFKPCGCTQYEGVEHADICSLRTSNVN